MDRPVWSVNDTPVPAPLQPTLSDVIPPGRPAPTTLVTRTGYGFGFEISIFTSLVPPG